MFGGSDGCAPNELVCGLAEPGSIEAGFLAKVPGAAMKLGEARLAFDCEESFCTANQLEAYERLIHDADGIKRLWEVAEPLETYAPGSWGAPGADALIGPRGWHLPKPS